MGELEGITQAPPALTMTGRTEIANGGTVSTSDDVLITCETNDMEVTVSDGATPYIYIDNAPSWVQGTNSSSTTNPDIRYQYYTHTLKGDAFAGATRVVKQGEGKLVLPTVVQKYTGATDVWNGTLQFDGTLESSPLWLNRHTKLVSDGGKFLGGITADYNATIYPGGDGKVGTIATTTLKLGFGARVVFDMEGTTADQLNATELIIEKKVWPNGGGPTYDTPVFQIKGSPAAGVYTLGTVDKIDGDVAHIVMEGLTGKKASLSYEDKKLLLTIQDYVAGDLTWTGASDGTWNTDETANFKGSDGDATVFVPGSTVTFDDNAQQTNIKVVGNVAPAAIVFNNDTKDFTLSGDSICGEPTLTKNGAGTLTVNNVNHMGQTTINGGTLAVASLANTNGTDYGSLGNVNKGIAIQNGGTLQIRQNTTSNQGMLIGEGGGNIHVNNGVTFTQSAGINGKDQVLTKLGAGTLGSPSAFNVGKLVIQGGTVSASENANSVIALPATVEFQGGTLRDPVSIYSYSTNNANFVVPEGQTGTFYADSRCNYKGKLTGSGTFNVYATSVRGYFQGDWSGFEGTLVAGTYSTDSYDENFLFDNNYGLPKATLNVRSGVTFDNNGHNVQVGSVAGSGTLGGSGTYTIGVDGKDIEATFGSTAPIVKTGEGIMTAKSAGALKGKLTIQQGGLVFYGNESTQYFTSAVTMQDGTTLNGSGVLTSLTMEKGATLTPIAQSVIDFSEAPGTIKTTAACRINEGAVLNMLIQSADEYSKIAPKYFTMNGVLTVTLMDGYTPKVGDTFTFWTATTFSGTPSYSLPALSEGLYWDVTDLAKSGILRVTDDATLGIGQIAANAVVNCEVFTVGGVRIGAFQTYRNAISESVKRLGAVAGTYIVKMTAGRNSATERVVIR